MPDERIVTFPWGVDIRALHPGSNGRTAAASSPDTFTLLSTRGWEPIYGVEVIAQAFVIAARQRPELRLVMLGNGSQAGRLRQIFAQGQVEEPRGLFPGWSGNADLPRYYQLRRPVPERFAQRRNLHLAAGGAGVRAPGAGLGYPRQPRVGGAGRERLVVSGWRRRSAGAGHSYRLWSSARRCPRWAAPPASWLSSAPIGRKTFQCCSKRMKSHCTTHSSLRR